jgi:uncharacterized membrane protein
VVCRVLLHRNPLGLITAQHAVSGRYGVVAETRGAWTAWPRAADARIDPYTRAHHLSYGLVPSNRFDTVEYEARVDDAGRPLDENCTYLVSGVSPQARWWSVSALATDDQAQAASEPRRGLVSGQLVYEPDLSFRISVSRELQAGNWLRPPDSGDPRAAHAPLYARLGRAPASPGGRSAVHRAPGLPMKTLLFWTVCILLLAGVVHLGYVLIVPPIEMRAKIDELRQIAGDGALTVLSREDSVRLMGPDGRWLVHALCVYDLAEGPVMINATVPNSYWSMAIYSAGGETFYSLNDRQAGVEQVDLMIRQPTDQAPDDEEEELARRPTTPSTCGRRIRWGWW